MHVKGREKMTKAFVAFLLGVLSFIVFMVVGETADQFLGDIAGTIVFVIVMPAYFFICQFLLSRGNPSALRKDWPVMLALGTGAIFVAFSTALVEKREVFLTQGLGFLLVWFVGTFAGALAASRKARRRGKQKLS